MSKTTRPAKGQSSGGRPHIDMGMFFNGAQDDVTPIEGGDVPYNDASYDTGYRYNGTDKQTLTAPAQVRFKPNNMFAKGTANQLNREQILGAQALANQLATQQALAAYQTNTLRPIERQQDIDFERSVQPIKADSDVLRQNNLLSEHRDMASPILARNFGSAQDSANQDFINHLARSRGMAGDQYSIGYNLGANELQSAQNAGTALGYTGEDLVANRPLQQQVTSQQLTNQLGSEQATARDQAFAQTLEGQHQALMNAELANRIKQSANPLAAAFPYNATAYNVGGVGDLINPAYKAKEEYGVDAKAQAEALKAKRIQQYLGSANPQQPVGAPVNTAQPSQPRIIGFTKDGKPITY